ncbi:MAG: hypothetical protein GX897_03590 [Clostridiales bacterium]|nr:hypothetical protein [Clostridiales bacterium]
MNLFDEKFLFEFKYDGKNLDESVENIDVSDEGKVKRTVYSFGGGLRVTTELTAHSGGAYEWVNRFENLSDKPTGLISDIDDASVLLPLPYEEPRRWTAYLPDKDRVTKIFAPSGSTWRWDEFYSDPDRIETNVSKGYIFTGETKNFATSGGRSSEAQAPFFNIHKEGVGYIVAVGWSGQWRLSVAREAYGVKIRCGIEDAAFRLMPGESFRTASFVVTPYEGSVQDGQNKWRKLVREEFSLIGKSGRDAHAPFCASIWGGMTTSGVLDRIRIIKENKLPFEYIWMDAGWYGTSDKPSPDEFEGDWGGYTGDWRVNINIHPDGLLEVRRAIADAGMKFLLWFEPERVISATPIAQEHPEYFIKSPHQGDANLLLNLGDEAAWEYCFETLSEIIEKLKINCLRQDFNISPLSFWRSADSDERKGITEIKYINGFYRLWDELLCRFPRLLIDNCASGGRRIDIETLRRSVPLWRSDAQCPANYPVELVQAHNLTFPSWLPWSGTGTGRGYDTYRARSAYTSGLTTNYTFSERDNFGDDPAKLEWIKKIGEEYLSLRRYFDGDFYPLTSPNDKPDSWSAYHYSLDSTGEGMIFAARREESPFYGAAFRLSGIEADAWYYFKDIDSGSLYYFGEYTEYAPAVSGKYLIEHGFEAAIDTPRTAKIWTYSNRTE